MNESESKIGRSSRRSSSVDVVEHIPMIHPCEPHRATCYMLQQQEVIDESWWRPRFTEDTLRNIGIGSHTYAKDGDGGIRTAMGSASSNTCADNDASVREVRPINRVPKWKGRKS